jgi:putative DNA primase/helicase
VSRAGIPEDSLARLGLDASPNGHSAAVTAGFNRTDLGNAERLVAGFGADLRYCHEADRWLVYDGRHWAEDRTGRVRGMARETVRGIGAEASATADPDERKALLKWAMTSEAKPRIDAMIGLAQAEPGVSVALDELDADAWRLNCLNGTIDLRTGELGSHRREDLVTKLAPVEYRPGARSEVWDRHLRFVTGGDEGRASFLKRAAGYSLTGDVSEEVLFFIHGPTAAVKSSHLEAIRCALGDYVRTADFEAFLARRDTGGARNDIARLAGARMVVSIEVDEGKRLAEGLIKMLTGGDKIAARFLYKETFEFLPKFKLWLAANHKPKIDPDDEAMWRRVLLVPFERVVPKGERDPGVKKALRDPESAGPAVLAWMVEGCLEWQREGLGVPSAVEDATERYREEMDPLRDFVEDCCIVTPDAWTATALLRRAYEDWGRETGTKNLVGPKKLGERLGARGCEPRSGRLNGKVVRGWAGIGLRSDVDTLTEVDPKIGKSTNENTSSREVTESDVNKRQRVNTTGTGDDLAGIFERDGE